MVTQQTSSVVSTSSLAGLAPMRYLSMLQRLKLSGQLLFDDPKGSKWLFFLHQGKLIYGTGGIHPIRRWQRNLAIHCPEFSINSLALKQDLTRLESNNFWDYQLLELWVKRQIISLEQARKTLSSIIVEILFDIGQTRHITHQFRPIILPYNPLLAMDVEIAIAAVEGLLSAWHNANLGNYSPHQSPTIKQPEKFKQNRSIAVYQTLINFLDGKHTLRDLAVQRRRDVVEIAASLLPYLELGWVELTNIPDLPNPVSLAIPVNPSGKANSTKPLVACIDDSLWVTQTMERLITTAGYQFISIDNPVRAIPILLKSKPDLIFLDLVMPNVNGYEICTQLRKLNAFRDTPIVILTGNNGAMERLQSKFVGASDFLSKPLDVVSLLKVLSKYLSLMPIRS